MGCSPTKNLVYNNYSDCDAHSDPKNLSGPFVKTNSANFDADSKDVQDKTYIEELLRSLDTYSNEEAFGWRKRQEDGSFEKQFSFIKYSEVKAYALNFAMNLVEHKLAATEKESGYQFLGLFARNCPDWLITDIACQTMNITSVTIYSTLGDLAFEHICNQTDLTTICITPDSAAAMIQYKQQFGLKNVQNVILFDLANKFEDSKINALRDSGLNVLSFSKLAKEAPSNKHQLNLAKPDSALTLCYTSGTTSLPKGADLSQRNFIAQMRSLDCMGYIFKPSGYHLCYLPLAHILERMIVFVSLIRGQKIGFITGDVKTYLIEDIRILRPTHLIAVPRVLDTFKKLIFDNIAKLPDGCEKSLAQKAINIKRENLKNNNIIKHALYDSLVFKKIRDSFGGRIEMFLTGSAPITKDLSDDIKILFSAPIVEGYGLTETTAPVVISHVDDLSNTSAGGCLYNSKIKLIDVPEMNYSSNTLLDGQPSPTGEILVGGPIVFRGYFKKPEETMKVLDPEGWFHTGDVGRIIPGNRGLKIIDRVKEIFKLSQGEYIAPSKLEGVYSKSKYVQQVCVYGDSTQNYIVGLIYPNPIYLKEILLAQGKWEDNCKLEDFYDDKQVVDVIKADLNKLANDNKFNSLEKLNILTLIRREFTVDNGCITPSFKLVRRKVKEEFQKEIDLLYGK